MASFESVLVISIGVQAAMPVEKRLNSVVGADGQRHQGRIPFGPLKNQAIAVGKLELDAVRDPRFGTSRS
jgi:hypothetical protein